MNRHERLHQELIPLKSLESFKLTSFYGYKVGVKWTVVFLTRQ